MLKRHSDALDGRLEQCVFTQGWCVIQEDELRLWYGKKITKNVWRDLRDRMTALQEDSGHEHGTFMICQFASQILIVEDDNSYTALDTLCDDAPAADAD